MAIGERSAAALMNERRNGPEPASVGLEDPGRTIRVLHLLADLAIGGGQTIVLNHLRHRNRARFDVRVAMLFDDDEMAPAYDDAGCPPVKLGYSRSGPVSTSARVARLLRQERIDILHVHSGSDRKIGQVAAFATGVPVVGHLHSEWIHLGVMLPDGAGPARRLKGEVAGRLRDCVERRTVNHYVAESNAVRRLFLPLVDAPIAVLQQSVALDRIDSAVRARRGEPLRRELGIDSQTPVLLNVSRMVAGKGQAVLVDTMAALVARGLPGEMVLVGDGDRRAEVQARIATHGLEARVHLLGNRLDIPDVLAMADVFVFASETEGFGLAVLEAMAAQLPVVAFRLPALQEFAVDGVTADFAEPGDNDRFAELAAALVQDKQRAARLGAEGHRVVSDRFSPAAVAHTFESVYEAVVARPRRRQRERRT